MRTNIYILTIFAIAFNCNSSNPINSTTRSQTNLLESKNHNIVIEQDLANDHYLIGISREYLNIEFYLLNKKLEIVDSLFTYKPNGEVYHPDYPCRIDTNKWICYFFDFEADYQNDIWISKHLISFDLRTGEYKKLGDFKSFYISEWELDLIRNKIIFRDYEQNKIFSSPLENYLIDTLFDFSSNDPWFLKMSSLPDKYELISKEDGRTIKRTLDVKNENDIQTDTIWETPSRLQNAEFQINKGIFMEVAPDKTKMNTATVFVYDHQNTLNKKSLDFNYTGNFRGSYWINDHIIVRNHNQIFVLDKNLALIKTIQTGILKDIYYLNNQLIIFEQFQPNKKFLKLDKNLELKDIDDRTFKNLMLIKAVPNNG